MADILLKELHEKGKYWREVAIVSVIAMITLCGLFIYYMWNMVRIILGMIGQGV